ncbi:MAG: ISKra4 family transposase ISMae18 [Chroococcopsis gigantea SAG 12.99]|nr:ISKra4 family transposase ISMae18 [Chroococcopsis gigantea SAG 12.99]
MTPQEKQELKKHLKSISEILVRNTPKEKLKDFEGIELAIREHFFEKIKFRNSRFFLSTATQTSAGRARKIKSIVGAVKITSRQSEKLSLKKNTRNSPFLEKCCLLLTANCSFQNAEVDIEKLTGIKVSSSSQHRLVEKYDFPTVRQKSPYPL